MTSVINPAFPLDFSRAYGAPSLAAQFRLKPEDFYVEEILGFPLSGEGEHLCLYIEKQSHNTHWVAAELARYSGFDEADISVCGRKDRHAVTRQWFSIYDPKLKAVDWSSFDMDGTKIITIDRHRKKLRLGDHQENHFVIRLRHVTHVPEADNEPVLLSDQEKQQHLSSIQRQLSLGVPNYFGVQRFGRNASNLLMANDWLEKGVPPPRRHRSMVLSAARSYLFNQILSYRVSHNLWQTEIEGDILDDLHPTGPLWGRGRLATSGRSQAIELEVLNEFQGWCERLEHRGLKQERRSLSLFPKGLTCFWQNDDLILSFNLPSGTFATAVLAEVALLHEAPR